MTPINTLPPLTGQETIDDLKQALRNISPNRSTVATVFELARTRNWAEEYTWVLLAYVLLQAHDDQIGIFLELLQKNSLKPFTLTQSAILGSIAITPPKELCTHKRTRHQLSPHDTSATEYCLDCGIPL